MLVIAGLRGSTVCWRERVRQHWITKADKAVRAQAVRTLARAPGEAANEVERLERGDLHQCINIGQPAGRPQRRWIVMIARWRLGHQHLERQRGQCAAGSHIDCVLVLEGAGERRNQPRIAAADIKPP